MRKRLLKIFLIGCLSVAVIAVSAHLIWKYSGSGQWELLRAKDGVTIYSLKAPGSTIKRFKGITHVHSTVPIAMAASMDDQIYTEICKWAGCVGARVLENRDERHQVFCFRMDYPFTFRPREFVAEQHLSVIPQTKALLIDIKAAPDKLPPNDCCVRIGHMHNTWLYTPLKNGDMEIQYAVDVDDGGFFPYILTNLGAPEFVGGILGQMQKMLDKEHEISPHPTFALLAQK